MGDNIMDGSSGTFTLPKRRHIGYWSADGIAIQELPGNIQYGNKNIQYRPITPYNGIHCPSHRSGLPATVTFNNYNSGGVSLTGSETVRADPYFGIKGLLPIGANNLTLGNNFNGQMGHRMQLPWCG